MVAMRVPGRTYVLSGFAVAASEPAASSRLPNLGERDYINYILADGILKRKLPIGGCLLMSF